MAGAKVDCGFSLFGPPNSGTNTAPPLSYYTDDNISCSSRSSSGSSLSLHTVKASNMKTGKKEMGTMGEAAVSAPCSDNDKKLAEPLAELAKSITKKTREWIEMGLSDNETNRSSLDLYIRELRNNATEGKGDMESVDVDELLKALRRLTFEEQVSTARSSLSRAFTAVTPEKKNSSQEPKSKSPTVKSVSVAAPPTADDGDCGTSELSSEKSKSPSKKKENKTSDGSLSRSADTQFSETINREVQYVLTLLKEDTRDELIAKFCDGPIPTKNEDYYDLFKAFKGAIVAVDEADMFKAENQQDGSTQMDHEHPPDSGVTANALQTHAQKKKSVLDRLDKERNLLTLYEVLRTAMVDYRALSEPSYLK